MEVEVTRFFAENHCKSSSIDVAVIDDQEGNLFEVGYDVASELFGIELKPGETKQFKIPKWEPDSCPCCDTDSEKVKTTFEVNDRVRIRLDKIRARPAPGVGHVGEVTRVTTEESALYRYLVRLDKPTEGMCAIYGYHEDELEAVDPGKASDTL